MDDLNRDKRVDSRDARVILQAVERVERAHPELVGGAALYRATKAHGPFAHVDVRGAPRALGQVVIGPATRDRSRQPAAPPAPASRLASLAVFGAAALGVIQFYEPPRQFIESRGRARRSRTARARSALASPNAFGRSGEVRVLFALPASASCIRSSSVATRSELAYAWVPFADTGSDPGAPSTRPLDRSRPAVRGAAQARLLPTRAHRRAPNASSSTARAVGHGAVLGEARQHAQRLSHRHVRRRTAGRTERTKHRRDSSKSTRTWLDLPSRSTSGWPTS